MPRNSTLLTRAPKLNNVKGLLFQTITLAKLPGAKPNNPQVNLYLDHAFVGNPVNPMTYLR